MRLKKLYVKLHAKIYTIGINNDQSKWGAGLHIVTSITDSLISFIETDNGYQDMLSDNGIFIMVDYNT